jgi:hypothetical protein
LWGFATLGLLVCFAVNAAAASENQPTTKPVVKHSAPYTHLLAPSPLKAPVRFAQRDTTDKSATPAKPVSQRAAYRPPLGYWAGYGGWYGGPRYTYYNAYGPGWNVYQPYSYSYQTWYGGWGGYPYYTSAYPGFGGYYAPYVSSYYYSGAGW